MVGFRLAEHEDAPAIGTLLQQCLNETPDEAHVQEGLIHAQDRAVYVAVVEDDVVGFVAGFTTVSLEGIQRWEIDLLAVRPAYQGQGIGRQLVNTSFERGRRSGAVLARALIQESNAASQRAFAVNGFIASEPMAMYVWTPSLNDTVVSRLNFSKDVTQGIIPVTTLTYRGLWLEGPLSERMVQAARLRVFKGEVGLIGAVIPRRQTDVARSLIRWRFKEGHAYRSWQKRF